MKRLCLLLLCCILVATAACSGGSSVGRDDHTISIAIMDSDDVFSSDNSFENGIAMATEDLNALYGPQGYTIETEFYNDHMVFQTGMDIVNQLANDPQLTAVVGTSSYFILDVSADILDAAGKILIPYYSCSDALMQRGYTHVFRNAFGEKSTGTAIAEYAASRSDIHRVAVYHSDTDFERRTARAFLRSAEDSSLEVVDVQLTTYLPAEIDAMLQRWDNLNVDTVFITQGEGEDAFAMLYYLRNRNPNINILGDFSFDYVDWLSESVNISNGIYIATPVPVESSPEVDAFREKYRTRYSSEPTQWAIQMYDSIRMVADTAVRIGSTDPEAISQALHSEEGYTGIGGTLTFDASGRLINRSPRLMVSEGGSFRYLEG